MDNGKEEQSIYNQYFDDEGAEIQKIEFPTLNNNETERLRDDVYFSNCGVWAIVAFKDYVGICGFNNEQWFGVRMLPTAPFDDRLWCINFALECFEDELYFFFLCHAYDDPYPFAHKEILEAINFVREKSENKLT